MVKQVIVVNMAANMGIGRLAAQISHASVGALIKQGAFEGDTFKLETDRYTKHWIQESFTKVVVKDWGNEKLEELKSKAEERGLPYFLMNEDGWNTALAIGPAENWRIQEITGEHILL